MTQSVQQKWEMLRDSLRHELTGVVEIVIRIPNWPPSSIEQAFSWMQASVYEGFNVAFLVERSTKSATVWLKKWVFGESEPDWSEIYAA